ncbi:hypothetical protein MYOV011v1_p0279 [Vibrio phage 6E35.1a]|nr:hypothetical protein MYOV011v1_p0279 [Vibrio phage 6E35.1a]
MGIDQELDIFDDWPVASASIPMPKAPAKFEPENELHQFFHDCSKFDWYYNYSDDHRVWTRGERESKALQARSRANSVTTAIYEAWSKYMFTGPNYGNERAPKPKWEDYRA